MDREWLRQGLLGLVLVIALGCVTVMLFSAEDKIPEVQEKLTAEISVQNVEPAAVPEVTSHMYELGIWQGNVAVYVPGAGQPLKVLETPASALPLPDQQALEERIPVADDMELAGYLEDYNS